jgi:flavin-dependent dehydrogenase
LNNTLTDINKLKDGSKVAVIGGGPSGTFFSYFLLDMAERIDLKLHVDIYDSRDFSADGPPGCNMCGGIISESLVQALATEGIDLPPTVVRRGIESYMLHMDAGSVQIKTPTQEKRIGAIYRGAGPRGIKESQWKSFDGYLLGLAKKKGAHVIKGRLEKVTWNSGLPEIQMKGGSPQAYDLLGIATGVNSAALKLFEDLKQGYVAPKTTKTFICEYYFGRETIEKTLGNSMHTFLLDLPRLEFAAIIPKGDYVTTCMLGKDIDKELVKAFLTRPEVKKCMPENWKWDEYVCQCMPKMNITGSSRAFMERAIFIGDCGISRLYKDGIGAAYKTAKAAVYGAVFLCVSAESFEKNSWPTYKKLENDNKIGKVIFFAVGLIQKIPLMRRAILKMITKEQNREESPKRMSIVLWDMFTGSAPYRTIFVRMLHPLFLASFIGNIISSIRIFRRRKR